MLPLLEAWVPSLVSEIRSCVLHSAAKIIIMIIIIIIIIIKYIQSSYYT